MNVEKPIFVFSVLSALFVLSGCMTLPGVYEAEQASEREDYLILREENRRLTGRLETVELQLEQVQMSLDRLMGEQRAQSGVLERSVDDQLRRLEQQLNAVDQARIKDREQIIEQLSAKIAQMMSVGSGRSSSSGRTTSSSGYAIEHEVGPGQTLSQIARAYGVSMKAIIDENQLDNPNQLRAGQILYIPE